jgi:hypothetical protein
MIQDYNEYQRNWYKNHPKMKDYHRERMKELRSKDPLFHVRRFFKSDADIKRQKIMPWLKPIISKAGMCIIGLNLRLMESLHIPIKN